MCIFCVASVMKTFIVEKKIEYKPLLEVLFSKIMYAIPGKC